MKTTRRNSAHNCNAGFTLAEVLVALAILGGGMFVLVNAHHGALQLHLITQEEVHARMLLELTAARAEMGVVAEELSDSGDFGPRYPGYTWTYEAQPMGDVDNPYMLDVEFFSVTATLQAPDGESTSVQFNTFRNPEMQTVVQMR